MSTSSLRTQTVSCRQPSASNTRTGVVTVAELRARKTPLLMLQGSTHPGESDNKDVHGPYVANRRSSSRMTWASPSMISKSSATNSVSGLGVNR